jgi:hypothetical protein
LEIQIAVYYVKCVSITKLFIKQVVSFLS